MRKVLQYFGPQNKTENTIKTLIVDRLNSYITNEEDKAELISFTTAESINYLMIGTDITNENWDAMKREAFDLAKQR